MLTRAFILALLTAGLVLVTASLAAHADDNEVSRSITVSASGSVAAEPDMARITSGVTSEAETAREALSRNSQVMEEVVAGLKAAGIAPADIQTVSFHVTPRSTRAKEGHPSVISGYRVTNQIRITARNLDRLGEILDKLVSFGANQMAGLSFEVSEAASLRDAARKEAVANALRRAKLYAVAADAELGDVLRVSEGVVGTGPRPVTMAMRAEAVPIERGTEELQANVTITWALE
jgi:hypothetical protein